MYTKLRLIKDIEKVMIKKSIVLSVTSLEKLKNRKISYIFHNFFFLLFTISVGVMIIKYLKKKNQLRY